MSPQNTRRARRLVLHLLRLASESLAVLVRGVDDVRAQHIQRLRELVRERREDQAGGVEVLHPAHEEKTRCTVVFLLVTDT